MRVLSSLTLLTALLISVAINPSVQAQSAAPALPGCDGSYAIVRVSEITPDGSMEKLKAAVDAHQAWYTSHGYKDLIYLSPVFVFDAATKGYTVSDKQALTYHIYGSTTPQSLTHDAAWDAYVKLYRDTSTIKESYFTCIPKSAVPSM